MRTDQCLALAKQHHLAGDLAAAHQLYETVLADEPANADVMFRLGVLGLQCATYDEALGWLDRAIGLAPRETRYRFARGQVLYAAGRLAGAIDTYRALLAFDATSADLWFALAGALQSNGDLRGAAAAYESAAALDPSQVDALNNLGNCQRQLGESERAQDAYRRALAVQPNHSNALTNLGTLLQENGQLDAAIELLATALQSAPDSPTCLLNLGVACCANRQFDDAVLLLTRTLELEPRFPEAAYNLGNALHALGRRREAQAQYRHAVTLDPLHADAHNNLGNVSKELGEYKAAADAFDAAIRARPGFVAAYNNAGNLMRTLRRTTDAEALFEAALAVDPRHSASHNNLGNVLKDCGALDEGIAHYRRAIESDPDNVVAHSNLAYALTFQAEDGAAVLEECRRWSAQHETPLRERRLPHTNDRTPTRRLRIGYVAADFRDHCQSLFTVPFFSHHNHEQFEIFCYASVERPDDLTRRLAGYANVWRDVRELDDEHLAQQIRADGIDILIDLAMHMADGRPLLFARKPAPVQVAWLAYPGTTGIEAIDYRLTDPHLDPLNAAGTPGTSDSHYTERSVRLPDSFWCYDPLTDEPAVNALPALTSETFTFGCLNNPCKLTDRTLAMWSAVLREVTQARLLLMAPAGNAHQNLARRVEAQGIDMQRVSFVPFQPRADYLRTYHQIDLGLDTFPYNGHTTSLDSLWMGVPVVTRVGATAVGRGGLTQLANLGLDELAANSDDEFVRTAVELAKDRPRLADLRQHLRPRMEQSPLMDGARFARHVETAYRQMWQAWCAQ
ncbi:tetratricopeptide repeat protein [Paraburkholderia sp. BCC1885]|uniref:tetratricopeptide repeat protein n=1 Tax=Paraburkholderia sp. BCC1885 TaxID=2562669 RepID=UPI00118362B4|nr:glycosyltransferase family 41 protein [Paraburkholderia sp. BCC1885]